MTAPIDFPDFAQAVNPPFALTSEAKASGGVDFNVPLPTGTVCVSLGVSSPFALETLTMTGHQTGESYTESSPIGDWVNYPLQWFPIDPADHSVDIDFQASTDTCTLYVGGSMTPVAVALTPGDQIFAELVGQNGATLATLEYAGVGPNPLGLALVVAQAVPQFWQAPTSIKTVQGLGGSGADIVAGVAGETIRLWSLYIDITSAGTAGTSIQDGAGNVVVRLDSGLAAHAQLPIPYSGAPLAGGAGSSLHWAGVSGSASANVTAVYSQA